MACIHYRKDWCRPQQGLMEPLYVPDFYAAMQDSEGYERVTTYMYKPPPGFSNVTPIKPSSLYTEPFGEWFVTEHPVRLPNTNFSLNKF